MTMIKEKKLIYMTEGTMHTNARPKLIQSTVLALLLLGMVPTAISADDAEDTTGFEKASKVQGAKPIVPLTPEELAEISKKNRETTGRELLTREVDESTADSLALEAAKLYQEGSYGESIDKYRETIQILEKVGENPRLIEKIQRCKVSISKAYYYWSQKIYFEAEDSANAGAFKDAIDKCKKAMEIYPPSKELMEEAIAKYERMQTAATYIGEVSEAAADPDKKERNYNIDVLLRLGEQFYQTKQWSKARDYFEEVLSINPYNGRAIEYLRKTYLQLARVGKARTAVTRIERQAEAIWNTVPPVINAVENQDLAAANNQPVQKNDFENTVQKKLKELVIDHIEFEDVSIATVVAYLKRESKRVDPDKVGVNIVLRLQSAGAEKKAAPKAEDAEEEVEEEAEEEAPVAKAPSSYTVTMVVDDITLNEAIKYICKSANLKYRIEKYAVVIASPDVPLDEVETRIYPVEKDALELFNSDEDPDKVNEQLQKYFEDRAVPFPAGSKVVYDNHISRLIVTNTPEYLLKVEELIKEMNVVDPQVLIQVKFVEIALNDLEELGFEYSFSRPTNSSSTSVYTEELTPGVPYTIIGSDSYNVISQSYSSQTVNGLTIVNNKPTTSTLTTNPLTKGDVVTLTSTGTGTTKYYVANAYPTYGKSTTFGANDPLVRNANNDPLAFGQEGNVQDTVFDWGAYNVNGYQFNAKIHAVDQANSTDILSAPRLTTMNGQEAVIRMVTERYYPESWGDSELGQTTSNNENLPYFVPSIPEFGDPTEEGIVLRVRPQVDADKYTIALEMNPVIQNMVDWTDYSYMMPLGDNGELYPNTLKMPVIEARTLNTNVSSYDGETIILGGIIKDTISEVDDSYPILGDIPLVGRLFQSKGKGSKKISLLVFMTCKLVNPDGSPLREREERGLPAFRY